MSRRGESGRGVDSATWAAGESFRQLVAAVQDYAIFLLDPDGRVASWNEGARRIKGYEESEILGKHFSIFYPPDEVAAGWPEHELSAAAASGRFEDEGWRIRKDGSRFWANVVITPLRPEEGAPTTGYLKITRDLTERRNAAEALRESEERLRMLIENVAEHAIFLLSPEGRIESWTHGAEEIFGYRGAEILGRHFSIFYPRETQATAEWELETARREGRAESEGWRVRKDGRRVWVNTLVTAVRDSSRSIKGFVKVTRDLTERRKIEALQEAERSKHEFLAILAHELRNPLATIRTAVQILRQAPAAGGPGEKARELADRQIQNMSRLLDDLLDLARMNRTEITLHREPLDLVSLAREAVEILRSSLESRKGDLLFEARSESVAVDADRGRLEQILSNLLANAVKYTDTGQPILVTVERDGKEAVLRVKDHGVGIDPMVLPRIFELFVQADRRPDRSAGGVGIGLTVVKRLAELQGGAVEAFSSGPGKGSEFVVRLPAIERGAAPSGPEQPVPEMPRLRVLVVDDNVDAADALGMLLDLDGQDTRVAYDGPSAIGISREFRPDVVFLDLELPVMDGYELARRLRENPETSAARLVAISGWDRAANLRRTVEAGIDHFVTKPADPSAIADLLKGFRRE